MAITINTAPSLNRPAYNSSFFVGTSSNVTQPNFKYCVDIFTSVSGSTGGTYVSRLNILPQPITSELIVNPFIILESYLSFDLVHNITAPTANVNSSLEYVIGFGEEYGDSSTGTTTYSGLTYNTGYTWNGVLQYEEAQQSNTSAVSQYIINNSSRLALTNMPTTTYIRNSTDRGTLSVLDSTQVGRWLQLITHQNSGGTLAWNIRSDAWSAQTPFNLVTHFPAGIYNLNNVNTGITSGGTQPVINLDTDYKYTLRILNSSLNSACQTYTYLIDTRCSKYQNVRFMFLSKAGGWDYFNFYLVSRKTINTKRNTIRKVLAWDYAVGDRGSTIIDQEISETREVNSNWINDEESVWLEELLTSSEVYELQDDGSILPIVINVDSKEIQKSINDKLFNYSFTYKMAYQIYSQKN